MKQKYQRLMIIGFIMVMLTGCGGASSSSSGEEVPDSSPISSVEPISHTENGIELSLSSEEASVNDIVDLLVDVPDDSGTFNYNLQISGVRGTYNGAITSTGHYLSFSGSNDKEMTFKPLEAGTANISISLSQNGVVVASHTFNLVVQ